jgi:Family of unknown function (DUF6298)/Protein of unknown function (DUF4038)
MRAAHSRRVVSNVRVLMAGLSLLVAQPVAAVAGVATGPLQVSQCNPRYFIDPDGRPVYLVGSHTWTNLQDDPSYPAFDFERYLALLERHGHNFIRLWTLESPSWRSLKGERLGRDPLPYARTGAEQARDGLPKFDLTKFNQPYFDRLHARVEAARSRGVYVAVMLFNGWSIEDKDNYSYSWLQRGITKIYRTVGMEPPRWNQNNPWHTHPFNRANNVNGIDADDNLDGQGLEIHTLRHRDVTALQERYVRKVIDTVNDLDNVLYEISNESRGESTEWQYHMVRFIHDYEATKPKRHPVLMSWQYPGGANEPLYQSPADAIAPGSDPRDAAYRTALPAADGRKIIISDTDHIWGVGGDPDWVWRSLMRGHHPIFMDPLAELAHRMPDPPLSEQIRQAMGQTRSLSERISLLRMTPRNDLCSTTYCLADPDHEYLVYLPEGGSATVNLGTHGGPFGVEWFDPQRAAVTPSSAVPGGQHVFRAPFAGPAVVHIKTTRPSHRAGTC